MRPAWYIILAATLAGTATASAEIDFEQYDSDRDGILSESEWRSVEHMAVDFESADANRDGALDRNEVDKAMQSTQVSDGSEQGTDESEVAVLADASDASDQGEIRRSGQFIEEDEDRAAQEQQQALEQQSESMPRTAPATTSRVGFDAAAEGRQAFQDVDADKDGRVSESEARLAGYEYVAIYFNDLDVDRDGFLHEEEWDLSQRAGMEEQDQAGARSTDISADEEAAYQDEDMAAPEVEQISEQDEMEEDGDDRSQYRDTALENEGQDENEDENKNNGSEQ